MCIDKTSFFSELSPSFGREGFQQDFASLRSLPSELCQQKLAARSVTATADGEHSCANAENEMEENISRQGDQHSGKTGKIQESF